MSTHIPWPPVSWPRNTFNNYEQVAFVGGPMRNLFLSVPIGTTTLDIPGTDDDGSGAPVVYKYKRSDDVVSGNPIYRFQGMKRVKAGEGRK